MFINKTDYELLGSMPEVKSVLRQLTEGKNEINGRSNSFAGMLSSSETIASLRQRSGFAAKKFKVEIREAENRMVWLRIMSGPGTLAVTVFLIFSVLSISALIGLPVSSYFIPGPILLIYFHLIGYSKDNHILGSMLDPLYFNSPAALSKTGNGLIRTSISTTNVYYIVCFVFIIYIFVKQYIRMFT